jgi:hypothetical protein
VQFDPHVADALEVQPVVGLLQLPAGHVLVGDAVESGAGTKAGEAGLLPGGDPAEERRERPVEAGERPPGHGDPVLQEVGPDLVQVLQLGELVEPGNTDAPLPRLPPFLAGSDRGAVRPFPAARFPSPPSEPDVRFSSHRALHGSMPFDYAVDLDASLVHGEGMAVPRYR